MRKIEIFCYLVLLGIGLLNYYEVVLSSALVILVFSFLSLAFLMGGVVLFKHKDHVEQNLFTSVFCGVIYAQIVIMLQFWLLDWPSIELLQKIFLMLMLPFAAGSAWLANKDQKVEIVPYYRLMMIRTSVVSLLLLSMYFI